MERITHSEAETEALGEELGRTVAPGTVIAFTGDLGAGKTAFTRGLARGLDRRTLLSDRGFPARRMGSAVSTGGKYMVPKVALAKWLVGGVA